MHPLLKRSLLFVGAIIVVLALLVWGIGLETIRARQVDLVYLGQQHMILVFSSIFFALLVGIPAGILLSRPAARGIAEYVMQIFNVGNTLPPLAVLALAMVVIGIGDRPPSSPCSSPRCCRSCAIPTPGCARSRRRCWKRQTASG